MYMKLESTELWQAVERAISMLESEDQLVIRKRREGVIGFSCHKPDACEFVEPHGFLKRPAEPKNW